MHPPHTCKCAHARQVWLLHVVAVYGHMQLLSGHHTLSKKQLPISNNIPNYLSMMINL